MAGIGDLILGRDTEPVTPTQQNTVQRNAAIAALGQASPPASRGSAVSFASAQSTPPLDPEVEKQQNTAAWMDYLQDPRVKAGFLQFGVSLLSGAGIGQSIGEGAQAIGNRETLNDQEEELARQADLDERGMTLREQQLELQRQQLARRGSGGGSGGRKKAAADAKRQKFWLDQLEDFEKARAESSLLTGVEVTPLSPPQKLMIVEAMMMAEGMDNVSSQEVWEAALADPARALQSLRLLSNPAELAKLNKQTPAGSASDPAVSDAIASNGAVEATTSIPTPSIGDFVTDSSGGTASFAGLSERGQALVGGFLNNKQTLGTDLARVPLQTLSDADKATLKATHPEIAKEAGIK